MPCNTACGIGTVIRTCFTACLQCTCAARARKHLVLAGSRGLGCTTAVGLGGTSQGFLHSSWWLCIHLLLTVAHGGTHTRCASLYCSAVLSLWACTAYYGWWATRFRQQLATVGREPLSEAVLLNAIQLKLSCAFHTAVILEQQVVSL
jgi:hypothetical protein